MDSTTSSEGYEYAIRLDNGQVVRDLGWRCPADVMHSFHGYGSARAYGTLIRRADDNSEWEEVVEGGH